MSFAVPKVDMSSEDYHHHHFRDHNFVQSIRSMRRHIVGKASDCGDDDGNEEYSAGCGASESSSTLKTRLTSPVKFAKHQRRLSLTPKRRLSQSFVNFSRSRSAETNGSVPKRKSTISSSWRDELDVPPGTTKEEAVAILLCRELETMDI